MAATAQVGAVDEEPQGFARNVLTLLERVEYRRCNSGEDLEAIYKLRYRAYRTHGIVSESPMQAMKDDLDDAPNCHRFGVFIDGQLASTIRVHHLHAAEPYAPAMTVFGDVLGPRLARGDSFIDPSRLAADPALIRLYRPLPYLTLRLAVTGAAYFNTTSCLSMVRDEHTAFYQRIFNSVRIAEPRDYASVTVQGILFESRCDKNMENTLRRFPFFRSTAAERRMLFARPGPGELAPLTILPTAKYYRPAA
ncbi:N-acyl amino acid synthase FeeM domain-containing protein [Tianweitania sp.]|uniref:N-acyl amino acid synthase FeeM domain-containing protein n=1 Tax=Tianweitania sp. TaxID=2021634 RepID=UPI0028971BAB|nr:hypothetical protein [Tianweitania sp.]